MSNSFRYMMESMYGVPEHQISGIHNMEIHHALDFPSMAHHVDVPKLVKSHLTSTSSLDRAIHHHDPEVRLSALQSHSPHINMSHIHSGLNDSHPLNRIQALHTSTRVGNLSAEHLHTALQDHNVDVQKAALRHPSINRTHIDTAMHSPNAEIRHIAAMHHAASPQHVLNHIHNPETSMAHKIDAINRAPSMHEAGLHGLLRHHDSAIQSAAHDALKVRTTPNSYHPLYRG